jgi:hypothetical protein
MNDRPVMPWHRAAAQEIMSWSRDRLARTPTVLDYAQLIARASPAPAVVEIPREVQEAMEWLMRCYNIQRPHSKTDKCNQIVCQYIEHHSQTVAEMQAWAEKAKALLKQIVLVGDGDGVSVEFCPIIDVNDLLSESPSTSLLALEQDVRRKTLLDLADSYEQGPIRQDLSKYDVIQDIRYQAEHPPTPH